jgi:hypothetical protein
MLTAQETRPDTTLADARECYAYWRARRSRLPWHRRAGRREARAMAGRWRARLVRAHLERFGLKTTGVIVEPVIDALGHTRRDHARWLWRTVGRRTPLASRKLWLAVALTAGTVATLGVVAVHAAWALIF